MTSNEVTPRRITIGEDECLTMMERSIRKSLKMLLDAVDRTPPTITSRPILEEVLDLLAGAYTTLVLVKKGRCRDLAYLEA